MPDTSRPIETPLLPQASRPPAPRRRRWRWLALALLLAAGAAAWWFWPQLAGRPTAPAATTAPAGGRAGRPMGPIPVTVAMATQRDIPLLLDALGTVQAFNSITIRSQVDGVLVEIAFTEGQEVKAGDVLARIDPRTYAAALAQAVARKAQDEAVLANARLDLQRYQELMRINGASRQQLDTQRALVAQNEALVQIDEAAVVSARTQLDFTTIRSPIDGRVGIRLVDQGNLIRAGDTTGIVVVNQLRPISVSFTLPQQELRRVLAAMREGVVPVQVLAPDGTVDATGTLLTPDNQVDQTTGTIRLKANFANEAQRLWPGAFVNVRLQVGLLRQVLTVPVVAVQRGPDGAFAFVVKPDGTVEQRPLGLGVVTATDAVVQRGLEPQERVVTSGALRLNPGSQVVVAEPGGGGRGPRAAAPP